MLHLEWLRVTASLVALDSFLGSSTCGIWDARRNNRLVDMALFRGVVSGTKNRPHRALSDRIKRVTHRRVGRCCSTTSTSRVRSRVDRSGAQNIPGCAGPDLSKRFGCFEGLGVRRPISCPPTKRQLPRALKRYRLFVCLFAF